LEQGRANQARTGAQDMTNRIFNSGDLGQGPAPGPGMQRSFNQATRRWMEAEAPGDEAAAQRAQGGRPLPMQVPPGQGNQILKKRGTDRKQAEWQQGVYERSAQSARQKADEASGGGFRALVGQQLQKEGRSPARDRIQSQLSMMRMLGIPV
jgi:hypothetical protein